MYNPCWAYAERILPHTEHTRKEFHRMLNIRGTNFISCWACPEMFKSWISRRIEYDFPVTGPWDHLVSVSAKKVKKCHACVPLREYCARIYRPSFHENKPKTLVFSHRQRAFWACFRENWVYKFRHGYVVMCLCLPLTKTVVSHTYVQYIVSTCSVQ